MFIKHNNYTLTDRRRYENGVIYP